MKDKILDYKKKDFYRVNNLAKFQLSDFEKVYNSSVKEYEEWNKEARKQYPDVKNPFIPTYQQNIAFQYLNDDKHKYVLYGGAIGCFSGDTRIKTPNGYISIKDVKIGDRVLSFNEDKQKVEIKTVKETFRYDNSKHIIRLTLQNNETITATEDHKFYFEGKWIELKDALDYFDYKQVEYLPPEAEKYVYDIEVDTNHSYLVGDGYIAHNSAKSFLGAYWVITMALQYPGTTYLVARKTVAQLRKSTLLSLMEVLEFLDIKKKQYKYNATENTFTFFNGSKIFLVDLDYQPSSPTYSHLDGYLLTAAWIDEVGEIREKAVNKVADRVNRMKNKEYGIYGKVLMTTNPSHGWLYDRFYKPWVMGIEREGHVYIPANTATNPHLQFSYIRDKFNSTDKNMVRRDLLGDWDYAENEKALLELEQIQNIFTNIPTNVSPHYMTVDIGGTGPKADNTIITVWRGWEVIDIKVRIPVSSEDIITFIRDTAQQYEIPMRRIAIDTSGMGEHIVSSVYLSGVYAFRGNSSPLKLPNDEWTSKVKNDTIYLDRTQNKTSYNNLRTQAAFMFVYKVKAGEVGIRVPKDTVIKTKKEEYKLYELVEKELSLLADENANEPEKKRKLIPKKDMKEVLGYSPDLMDTLTMRSVFDIIEQYDDSMVKPSKPLQERKFFKKRIKPFGFI